MSFPIHVWRVPFLCKWQLTAGRNKQFSLLKVIQCAYSYYTTSKILRVMLWALFIVVIQLIVIVDIICLYTEWFPCDKFLSSKPILLNFEDKDLCDRINVGILILGIVLTVSIQESLRCKDGCLCISFRLKMGFSL